MTTCGADTSEQPESPPKISEKTGSIIFLGRKVSHVSHFTVCAELCADYPTAAGEKNICPYTRISVHTDGFEQICVPNGGSGQTSA